MRAAATACLLHLLCGRQHTHPTPRSCKAAPPWRSGHALPCLPAVTLLALVWQWLCGFCASDMFIMAPYEPHGVPHGATATEVSTNMTPLSWWWEAVLPAAGPP